VSPRLWIFPVLLVVWVLLWRGTFGLIENGVAMLGLVTLVFAVGVWKLGPSWSAVARGLVPRSPGHDRAQYAFLAVSILGATISPYLVSFYSSGAIEDKWTAKELVPNRFVAALGMGFGSAVSMAVLVVAAMILRPAGVRAETYQQASWVLNPLFGRAGLWLFCGSLAIGCIGAALEIALDVGYITAQSFGWEWGENKTAGDEARFALSYTVVLALAAVPTLFAVDPLKLTMFSMGATVLALPLVVGPLIVIMNDRSYLKTHTNGWIANVAVTGVLVLAAILAVVAIPLQLIGGS
jgi:Mn2+/Fe2+ NRAMP family transporter